MPLVIDTYNVTHQTGILPPELSGPDTAQLATLIARSRWQREPTLLVCDGRASGTDRTARFGKVRVHYAGPSQSADEVIIAMVARTSSPRQLTVVTSDREILRAAKARRCPTLRSDKFLELLAEDLVRVRGASRNADITSPPRKSVQHWKEFFGLTDELEPDLASQDLTSDLLSRLRNSASQSQSKPAAQSQPSVTPQSRKNQARPPAPEHQSIRPHKSSNSPPASALPPELIAEAEQILAELEGP